MFAEKFAPGWMGEGWIVGSCCRCSLSLHVPCVPHVHHTHTRVRACRVCPTQPLHMLTQHTVTRVYRVPSRLFCCRPVLSRLRPSSSTHRNSCNSKSWRGVAPTPQQNHVCPPPPPLRPSGQQWLQCTMCLSLLPLIFLHSLSNKSSS